MLTCVDPVKPVPGDEVLERSGKCNSGFVGVHDNSGSAKAKPWTITVNGAYMGSFSTPLEAVGYELQPNYNELLKNQIQIST